MRRMTSSSTRLVGALASVWLAFGAPAVSAQEGVGSSNAPETEVPLGPASAVGALPGKVSQESFTESDGQVVRYEAIEVPYTTDEASVVYTFTSAGATISSAQLMHERYVRDPMPETLGVPAEKVNAGPVDVVTTWSPGFLPYRVVLRNLVVPEPVTRIVRVAPGGTIKAGLLVAPSDAERGKFEVDRPVRKGDQIVVTAPAELAGEYPVAEVRTAGGLVPTTAFPVPEATGVVYTVKRVGDFKALFAVDPGFTRVSGDRGLPVTYVWPDPARDASQFWLEKRFTPGQHPYELNLEVTLHNIGDRSVSSLTGLNITGWQHPGVSSGNILARPTNIQAASCGTPDGLERSTFPELQDTALESLRAGQGDTGYERPQGSAIWTGIDSTYFMTAARRVTRVPGGQCILSVRILDPSKPGAATISSTHLTTTPDTIIGSTTGCVPGWLAGKVEAPTCDKALEVLGVGANATRKEIDGAWNALRGGGDTAKYDEAKNLLDGSRKRKLTYRFQLYSGPKDVAFLSRTAPELGEALDLGMFGFISKPLHSVLVWLEGGLGSWALAIILLTVLIKLVLLPLTNKSYRSMQKMQKLKPKLDALKKQHGDDRQAFAREQMAMFKREGVNPLGGCLPMLLQMPVWFGLYQMIYSSVELYHAPMGLWIHDLSSPDPYFIMPVLLGLLMFVQTFLTTSTATMDGLQGKILKFGMPVMFSVFMLFLPAGLVLYIFVNVGLTIVQNLVIRRRMGIS